MSYVARSNTASRNFSSLSASGNSGNRGVLSSAASVFGGAGGIGSRISVSNVQNLSNMLRPHVQLDNGKLVISNEKETMRGLNDRLAGYLSKVRTLEESNSKLEDKIKEVLEKRGTGVGRDWSVYEQQLATLKGQLQDMTMDNARLLLQIDNARLAADDFKVKFETEQGMRQGVEQDITGLRKLIDETQLSRMQLESQIESLKQELLLMKKDHEEDVDQLRGQISSSSISVEMDNRKGEDLSETINKIRQDYEKAALKSREDTEAWYQSKFDNITAEVTKNTEAIQTGQSELNDLRRQKQALEIDLQAVHNMNRSFEDTLNDTQSRTAQEINQYNKITLQLEDELSQVRTQVERQGLEYQTLLNLKMKLEAEIATYHGLLEGLGLDESNANKSAVSSKSDDKVDFALEQALYAAPPPASLKKVLIISQEIVDGEVVSETEQETVSTNGAQTYELVKEAKREKLEVVAPVTVCPAVVVEEEEEEEEEKEEEEVEEQEEKEEVEVAVEVEVEEGRGEESENEQPEDWVDIEEDRQLSENPPVEDEAVPEEGE